MTGAYFLGVRGRLDEVEDRVTHIEYKIEMIESHISRIEQSVNVLDDKVDRILIGLARNRLDVGVGSDLAPDTRTSDAD